MKNDAAASAPEVDHTLLAPQCRGDNEGLEIAVDQGIPRDLENSFPEAAEIKSSEYSSEILTGDTLSAQKSNGRRTLLIIALVILIAAALGLGLGLGLGLSRKENNENNQSTVQSSTSEGPATGPQPGEPSATDTALQHSILANTSIAAISLPDDSRYVFLQEKSGAFRRAIYSPQASLWQASKESSLVTSAKSKTPLAVARWLDYSNHTYWVTLFYVNSTKNALSCTHWKNDSPSECSVLDSFPESTVAEGSRQISATVLSDDISQGGLLLTYQNPLGQLIILHGFSDAENGLTWSGRNETDLFNSMLSSKSTGYRITDACTSSWGTEGPNNVFYLYCFAKKSSDAASSQDVRHVARFQVFVDRGAPYNVTIEKVQISDEIRSTTESDIILLSHPSGGPNATLAAWSVPSAMQSFPHSDIPSPKSEFPYDRFAFRCRGNKAKSYVYHQLSDTEITQDVWDDDNRIWTSSSFTMET